MSDAKPHDIDALKADGTFLIPRLLPGTYTLRLSSIGYETVTLEEVQVAGDSVTHLDIALASEAIRLKEIVVIRARSFKASLKPSDGDCPGLPILMEFGLVTKVEA